MPLIEESQFCAPCHFGVFWDALIYNSFGEWLESSYSDPSFENAKTCLKSNVVMGFEGSGRRMNSLVKQYNVLGRRVPMSEIIENIEAVSLKDIKSLCSDRLGSTSISLAALGPFSSKMIVDESLSRNILRRL